MGNRISYFRGSAAGALLLALAVAAGGCAQSNADSSGEPGDGSRQTQSSPGRSTKFKHKDVAGLCADCHDGIQASGKPAEHIASTASCDACHSTKTWLQVEDVDHAQVLGECSRCHDGVLATGKSATHPATSGACDQCHGTRSWSDLLTAGGLSGKPATHIASSDNCAACHTAGTDSPPTVIAHTEVLGTCDSCHNGVIASGKTVTHVLTTRQCNVCHTTDAWIPAFSPPQVVEKPATHIATSNVCDACHDPAVWLPVLRVDHTQVLGTCASCHNGTVASGKSATHIASTNACDACHGVTAWTPVAANRVDHTQVIGVCSACHSLPGGHSPTDGQECDACHNTSSWPGGLLPPPPPATGGGNGGVPDHTTLVGNCISCHNGVVASGKSVNHMNTTDACEACHDKFPAPWLPVAANRVDHTQVLGTCSSCHNGVTATGKTVTHVVTSAECDVCHTTLVWLGAVVVSPPQPPVVGGNPVDHSTFIGNCVSCHNGVAASGKSATHIASSNACDNCHDKFPLHWTPVPANRVDHTQVIGVCSTCHTLPGGHSATGGQECNVCHITTNWLTI